VTRKLNFFLLNCLVARMFPRVYSEFQVKLDLLGISSSPVMANLMSSEQNFLRYIPHWATEVGLLTFRALMTLILNQASMLAFIEIFIMEHSLKCHCLKLYHDFLSKTQSGEFTMMTFPHTASVPFSRWNILSYKIICMLFHGNHVISALIYVD
jgi:hypothetical protein